LTKIVDAESRRIDYRLNILGVRVWENSCRLIAKTEKGWIPVGGPHEFPLKVPEDSADLQSREQSPLTMTLFQYKEEFPYSDMPEVLSREKAFDAAIRDLPVIALERPRK
jgi:hypothetical protein